MANIHLGTFADDTVIAYANTNLGTMQAKLQDYLNVFSNWALDWRIKVNNDKTVATLFTRKHKITPPLLHILNKSIEWNNRAKYLGITMDSKLTWAAHIDQALRKGQIALSNLYPLLARRSKLSTKNKLLLYKAIIQPAALYGCEVWGSAAKTHLRKIQVFQNKALRLIVDAPWFISNYKIHDDLETLKIKDIIIAKAEKIISRSRHSQNPTVQQLSHERGNWKNPHLLTSDFYELHWDF